MNSVKGKEYMTEDTYKFYCQECMCEISKEDAEEYEVCPLCFSDIEF